MRILHVGNIANNAYFNAKVQRDYGMEADVLARDYYYYMDCPEWVEVELDSPPDDVEMPDWRAMDLKGFERPKWFVQGPPALCSNYLSAKLAGDERKAEVAWGMLSSHTSHLKTFPKGVAKWKRMLDGSFYGRFRNLASRLAGRRARRDSGKISSSSFRDRCGWLLGEFSRLFPERNPRLSLDDLLPYESAVQTLYPVFKEYDVIQAYATEGIYPLLMGLPYVAFEHGTIRDIPFEDSQRGRVALTLFSLADVLYMTNGDSMRQADYIRKGKDTTIFGIHGFD